MRGAPPGLAALLRLLPVPQVARRDLHRRLARRQRHYHGAAHVALLWQRHARLAVPCVPEAILATAGHLAACPARPGPSHLARDRLLGLDLTPLGERAEEFARNTARLRLEAAHLSDAAWEAARLRFLRRMAAAPRLFRSRAAANLSRTLAGAGGTS